MPSSRRKSTSSSRAPPEVVVIRAIAFCLFELVGVSIIEEDNASLSTEKGSGKFTTSTKPSPCSLERASRYGRRASLISGVLSSLPEK
jgi:hypothetical protein